jgi:hypothetical protein
MRIRNPEIKDKDNETTTTKWFPSWAYLGFCQGGCTFLAGLPPPPPPPDLEPDPDPHQDFDLDPDPHQKNADLQPWAQLSKDCCLIYNFFLVARCLIFSHNQPFRLGRGGGCTWQEGGMHRGGGWGDARASCASPLGTPLVSIHPGSRGEKKAHDHGSTTLHKINNIKTYFGGGPTAGGSRG